MKKYRKNSIECASNSETEIQTLIDPVYDFLYEEAVKCVETGDFSANFDEKLADLIYKMQLELYML